jgi:ABC-2 type transport system ATP-binding protein
MIALRGVTKYYGRSRGVEAVDLDVLPGEVFGYLGPNGAGKTTTIRLLLDLIRPDCGRARVFGLDSRREGVRIRRRIGYLPGELALYENFSVRELLRFLFRLKGASDWTYAEKLGERLGCPWTQKISTLSHGNKQKVGLIQALMHRPELVILDEPTTGLDPLVQHEFYAIVREAKARGQTVFLSSHNLPEVEKVCDRVGIIRGGRIVAVESIAALQERSLRNVEIRFAGPIPPGLFASLPKVRILGSENGLVKCRVQGEVDSLIKELARHHVTDFLCQHPTLEEIFLAYYGEGSDAA